MQTLQLAEDMWYAHRTLLSPVITHCSHAGQNFLWWQQAGCLPAESLEDLLDTRMEPQVDQCYSYDATKRCTDPQDTGSILVQHVREQVPLNAVRGSIPAEQKCAAGGCRKVDGAHQFVLPFALAGEAQSAEVLPNLCKGILPKHLQPNPGCSSIHASHRQFWAV